MHFSYLFNHIIFNNEECTVWKEYISNNETTKDLSKFANLLFYKLQFLVQNMKKDSVPHGCYKALAGLQQRKTVPKTCANLRR